MLVPLLRELMRFKHANTQIRAKCCTEFRSIVKFYATKRFARWIDLS